MTFRRQWRNTVRFAGMPGIGLLLAGALLGVLLFLSEIFIVLAATRLLTTSFGPPFGIVSHFLSRLGGSPRILVVLLLLLLVFRASLQISEFYLEAFIGSHFKLKVQRPLIDSVFLGQTASGATLLDTFSTGSDYCRRFFASVLKSLVFLSFLCLTLVSIIKLMGASVLVLLGGVSLFSLPVLRLNRRVKRSANEMSRAYTRLSEQLGSGLRNILLLKIHGVAGQEREKARGELSKVVIHMRQMGVFTGIYVAIPQLTALVCIVGIFVFSPHQAMLGRTSPLVTFFALFRLVSTASQVYRAGIDVFVYFPLCQKYIEEALRESAPALAPSRRGEGSDVAATVEARSSIGWRVRELSFRYPGSDAKVIDRVGFDIPPGAFVVLAGPSGSGKSTLIQLLLGLFKPEEGRATLLSGNQEQDASEAGETLLRHVGYVGPESYLISGTLRQNLLYGLPASNISDSEIHSALHLAHCDFVLRGHRASLDTSVTERGEGLSAGQKQRLCLARAILRNPALLVLDEATANLDRRTERHIVDSLCHLKGKMTILAASHQPELIAAADQVIDLIASAREQPHTVERRIPRRA